jgi:hypothetical protein
MNIIPLNQVQVDPNSGVRFAPDPNASVEDRAIMSGRPPIRFQHPRYLLEYDPQLQLVSIEFRGQRRLVPAARVAWMEPRELDGAPVMALGRMQAEIEALGRRTAAAKGRDKDRVPGWDRLTPVDDPLRDKSIDAILAEMQRDTVRAAAQVVGLLPPDEQPLAPAPKRRRPPKIVPRETPPPERG